MYFVCNRNMTLVDSKKTSTDDKYQKLNYQVSIKQETNDDRTVKHDTNTMTSAAAAERN